MSIIDLLLSGWMMQLLYGAVATVILSICAFCLGLCIALFFVAAKLLNLKFWIYVQNVYTTIFRGLPELLVVFFFFFTINYFTGIVSYNFNVSIEQKYLLYIVAVIALGLISGCYLTETLRGALSAIPRGQIEAAQAVGMSNFTMLMRIVFPQVIEYGWRGIINIWLLGLKDSSIVMVIGVTELMFKSNLAVTTTNNPFLFYGLAGFLYILMAMFSSFILRIYSPEKKYKKNLIKN